MTLLDSMKRHHQTITSISRQVGTSYEHIRKIVKGDPVVSKQLNAAICTILQLPEQDMWALAQQEKSQKKFGAAPGQFSAQVLNQAYSAMPRPAQMRLNQLSKTWPRLSAGDQQRVLSIVETFAQK